MLQPACFSSPAARHARVGARLFHLGRGELPAPTNPGNWSRPSSGCSLDRNVGELALRSGRVVTADWLVIVNDVEISAQRARSVGPKAIPFVSSTVMRAGDP